MVLQDFIILFILSESRANACAGFSRTVRERRSDATAKDHAKQKCCTPTRLQTARRRTLCTGAAKVRSG